jgi:CubicO group peptidase (beta-lactamase class C family)
VTIRHLLTHTSGLRVGPIFYRPLIQASDEHPDAPSLQLEVARFGATGPEVTPGTSYSYSNAGYNTLGALIEVASQMPLADFLRERLYAPLGMKDSLNHESQAEHSRMSKVYRGGREGRDAAPAWTTSWKPGDAPDYPFVRASGGMISTAWDYATFCRMFLNGGIHGERRLLRADTVEIMTQPQTRALYSNEEIGRPSSFYGLGWQVSAGGVFSHGGSDGTQAWIDPERDLIVLALTQTPGARPDPRGRFRQAVVEACVD